MDDNWIKISDIRLHKQLRKFLQPAIFGKLRKCLSENKVCIFCPLCGTLMSYMPA